MIRWAADFTAPDFGFSWGVQEKDPSRHAPVTDPLGVYPKVGRITVLPGDSNVAGSGTGERCEALIPTDQTGGTEGTESWWAWDVVFGAPWTPTNSAWNVVTQWHNSGTTEGTTCCFVTPSQLRFQVYGGAPGSAGRFFDLGTWSAGVRIELALHVLWSSDPAKGFVELWRDGKQVAPHTSCATLYTGQTVYFKQGYYRAAQTWNANLYYHGTCRGDTLSEVAAHAFPASKAWTPAPPPVDVKALVAQSITDVTAAQSALADAQIALSKVNAAL